MSLYDDLVNGKFSGYVLLAQLGSTDTFFGWDEQYVQSPEAWRLVPGSFDTVTGTQPTNWKKTAGYYVCAARQPQCWAILGSGPYAINFRNLFTGGLPEDINIFTFQPVSAAAGTVKVCWTMRGTFLANAPEGWVFGEGTPEVFRVAFPGYTQGAGSAFPSSIIWAGA